jgi:signal peptidase I
VQYPSGSALERTSPQDRVSEKDIQVYQDRIVINLEGAQWARFADTNSMDPVLDNGANAIQVQPASMDEIEVGDIISYRHSSGKTIIHRVIEKNVDGQGWYVIAKGDNNPLADPDKVRFEQISRVVVAIIY